MMKIASRYRPFSHEPGCSTCILGTRYAARFYPTSLFILDEEGESIQIEWQLKGPIKDFTVTQDLEKNRIIVHGFSEGRYFNYQLFAKDAALMLKVDRAQGGHLKGILQPLNVEIILKPKEHLILFALAEPVMGEALERISFGHHKKQEWERIRRRNDPLEYLPFWFAAGQLSLEGSSTAPTSTYGTLEYVRECYQLLDEGKKEQFFTKFTELFQVGFKQLLFPQLYDANYLGVDALKPKASKGPTSKEPSSEELHYPLALLKEGYRLIRAMLLQIKEGVVFVLPHLPEIFHAGRSINLRLPQAICSLEWSKKLLKKVVLKSLAPQTLHFRFQKPLKSFRLQSVRLSNERLSSPRLQQEPGRRLSCDAPVTLGVGTYILDQFRK